MTHKIAGNISFFLCKKGMIEGKEQDYTNMDWKYFWKTMCYLYDRDADFSRSGHVRTPALLPLHSLKLQYYQ